MDRQTLTGVICGGVFGGIFLMTCVLSAVKAVRDRKRIKKSIEEKRLKKLQTEQNGILKHDEESGIVSSENGDSPRRNGLKPNGVIVTVTAPDNDEESVLVGNGTHYPLPTNASKTKDYVSSNGVTITESHNHTTVVTIENKMNGTVVGDSKRDDLDMNYRGVGTPNGITNPAFMDDQSRSDVTTQL